MLTMSAQKTVRSVGRFVTFLGIVLGAVLAFPGDVQASESELTRAFDALEAERWDDALELLDDLKGSSTDGKMLAKVTYYRGFALEKLGRCESAELAYRRVLDGSATPRLRSYARDALDGFDARCIPAPEADLRQVEMPRGSGRVGWKVFGWTSMIVGGLTLAAIPVKSAVEDDIVSQGEPYFQVQYNCDVSDGEVKGDNCDRTGLSKDPAYVEYEETRATSQRWSDVMLYSGAGLAAVGLTTVVLVAATRPDAGSVTVAITPTTDGAYGSATIRF